MHEFHHEDPTDLQYCCCSIPLLAASIDLRILEEVQLLTTT